MRKIFTSILLSIVGFTNAQTFVAINDTRAAGNIKAQVETSKAVSTSPIDEINTNSYIVISSVESGSSTSGGSKWGKVDIPVVSGTTTPPPCYVALGAPTMLPVCNKNYVVINTTLKVRPSAGDLQHQVTTSEGSGGNAVVLSTQKFVLTPTASVHDAVNNLDWYEIYLAYRCSQSTGWIANNSSKTYLTLNQPSATQVLGIPTLPTNIPQNNIGNNSVIIPVTTEVNYYDRNYEIYNSSNSLIATISSTTTISNQKNASNNYAPVTDNLTISGLPFCTQYNNVYVIEKNNNGCVSAQSNTVSFKTTGCNSTCTTPAVTVNTNSPVASGGTLNLSATPSGNYTYSWTGPNGFSSSQQNPSINNFNSNMVGQQYCVTMTQQGCTPSQSCTTVSLNNGACTYSIYPTSISPISSANSGSISVTANSGCNWTATSNASWLTVTSGSSSSGSGTINYTYTANTTTSSRTGIITVTGGQTFTVTQAGATSPTNQIPKIDSVENYNNQVTYSASPQTITIYGSNFVQGCTVTLNDLTNGGSYPKSIIFISSTEIQVTANFTNTTATWSAQVTSPQFSNVVQFNVTATTSNGGQTNNYTVFGIDVSAVNGTVDWVQVFNKGNTKFAFIKATRGLCYTDTQFDINMKQSRSDGTGVIMGAYHYALPEDNKNAIDEANYFLAAASQYIKIGYLPPVLDIEDPQQSSDCPTNNLKPLSQVFTSDDLATWIKTWMETVKNKTGVTPILYADFNHINFLGQSKVALNQYPLWIADYGANTECTYTTIPRIGVWSNWIFHQYLDPGPKACNKPELNCPGISVPVDLDVFYGNDCDFKKLIGNNCSNTTTCTDNFESNNTVATATKVFQNPLNSSSSDYTLQGNIGYVDDVDWYKVDIGTCGTLTVNLSNLPYNYNLEIWNSTGTTVLKGSYNTSTTNESASLTFKSSDVVYVKIYSANPATDFTIASCYNLQFLWDPNNCCYSQLDNSNIPKLLYPLESPSGSSNDKFISGYKYGDDWENDCGGKPKKHTGIDIQNKKSSQVVMCAYDGIIKEDNIWLGDPLGVDWGNAIIIEHIGLYNQKFYTAYLHIDKKELKVGIGNSVHAGDILTHYLKGNGLNHLHFNVFNSNTYDRLAARGALPAVNQSDCKCKDAKGNNDELFPYYFIDPNLLSYNYVSNGNSPTSVSVQPNGSIIPNAKIVFYANDTTQDYTDENGILIINKENATLLDSIKIIAPNYDTCTVYNTSDNLTFEKNKIIIPCFKTDGVNNKIQSPEFIFNNAGQIINTNTLNYTVSALNTIKAEISYPPNQDSIYIPIGLNSNNSYSLDTGYNLLTIRLTNDIQDTVLLTKAITFIPSNDFIDNTNKIKITSSSSLIGTNIFVNNVFETKHASFTSNIYSFKGTTGLLFSKNGYKDTLLQIFSDTTLNIDNFMVPISYSSLADSSILFKALLNPQYWRTITTKNLLPNNNAQISVKQYDDDFANMGLLPQTRKFAFRNLNYPQPALFKTAIALDQIETPDSAKVYLLNIKNGNQYYKYLPNTTGICEYDPEVQKIAFDSLNFKNNAATEELVLMKKQPPVINNNVIKMYGGETKDFPISTFFKNPDSIQNDIAVSSSTNGVEIVNGMIRITAPLDNTNPLSIKLSATHDFLTISNEFNINIETPLVFVPTSFTPNGDGKNDIFKPTFYGAPSSYHLVIYNRYGEKIFETEDYTKGWDGKTNGHDQIQGTYVWIMKYQLGNEHEKIEKGTVTVIK